ncbi:MAG TPA: hypothetical protein VFS67_21890 [Polyangiaceae bacterium]|nr:hypothetical protein [Polyangiaceae bacterium]
MAWSARSATGRGITIAWSARAATRGGITMGVVGARKRDGSGHHHRVVSARSDARGH